MSCLLSFFPFHWIPHRYCFINNKLILIVHVYVEISEFVYYTCTSKFIGNLIIGGYGVQNGMILHLRGMPWRKAQLLESQAHSIRQEMRTDSISTSFMHIILQLYYTHISIVITIFIFFYMIKLLKLTFYMILLLITIYYTLEIILICISKFWKERKTEIMRDHERENIERVRMCLFF